MPYDAHVRDRRTVTPAAYARLQRAASARPTIVFAGEFSAGKSTLLNALLQIAALPTKITATALPPVWLRHGPAAAHYEDNSGKRHPVAIDDLDHVPPQARCLHINLPIEILRSCDFIDLPGISDPHRHDSHIHRYLRMAHMVVWCSPATQAWRQSERSTWLNMPARLYAHSLLVLTRGDKLDSERDRAKVLRRVQTESKGLFADYMIIDQPPNRIGQGPAHPLMPLLHGQLEAILEKRASLLQRYLIGAADEPEPPHVAAPAAAPLVLVPPVATEAPRPHLLQPAQADAAPDPLAELVAKMTQPESPAADRAQAILTALPETDTVETDDLSDEALISSLLSIRAPASPIADAAPAPAHVSAHEPDDMAPEAFAIDMPSPFDMPSLDISQFEDLSADPPADAPETAPDAPLGEPAPEADLSAPDLPAEVQLWRDMVAEADLTPQNAQIAALFDRYLLALSTLDKTR